MGLATHIVVSKVHFWVIWESGKFGLKKGTGVDPPPPRADNVPFFYRFFSRRPSLNILTPFFGDLLIQTDPQSERVSKHFSNTAGNNVWLQNTLKVLSYTCTYTCILSKLKKSIFVEKSGCLMFSKEAQWHLPTLGWQSHQGSQLRLNQRKLASLRFWYLDFSLQSNPDNREISFSKFEIWPPWHLLH